MEAAERLFLAETNNFEDLVRISGLDPVEDFIGARLNEVDFSGSNLANFDFRFADLRGAVWDNAIEFPNSYDFSLRGRERASVHGSDFQKIRQVALNAKTWSERFFAFKLLVDNWGETVETQTVLEEIIQSGKGTYFLLCSFLYFAASYNRDFKSTALCEEMADRGSSQFNVGRIGRVRRAIDDYMDYYSRKYQSVPRFPGDVNQRSIFLVGERVMDGQRDML